MAKKCPNCGAVNPSKATQCSKCGTLFDGEKPLSEEEKLQIQLKKEHEENERLKEALEKAQKNEEKAEDSINVVSLEKDGAEDTSDTTPNDGDTNKETIDVPQKTDEIAEKSMDVAPLEKDEPLPKNDEANNETDATPKDDKEAKGASVMAITNDDVANEPEPESQSDDVLLEQDVKNDIDNLPKPDSGVEKRKISKGMIVGLVAIACIILLSVVLLIVFLPSDNDENLKSSDKNNEATVESNEALKDEEDSDYYDEASEVVEMTDSETATANDEEPELDSQKDKTPSVNADKKQATKLEVSETSIVFASEAKTTKNITVKGDNWNYKSSGLPSWLDCRKTGSGLSVSCKDNTSIDSRTYNIVVTSDGNQRVEIRVKQNGADEYLTLAKSTLNFDKKGGNVDVKVNTNASGFSIQNDSKWLKVNKNGNTISIVCEKNPDRQSRKASVVVTTKSGKIRRNLDVFQDKK